MKPTDKTNAMRLLDQKKISYLVHYYDCEIAISGNDVAKSLNEDVKRVFKTLVTIGKSKKYYVFVIPSDKELDLKKAAKEANEKNIEMVKSRELLPLTGYIHGGCSPVGMKKLFKTFIDITADDFTSIYISGGKRGIQIEINVDDLSKIVPLIKTSLTVKDL